MKSGSTEPISGRDRGVGRPCWETSRRMSRPSASSLALAVAALVARGRRTALRVRRTLDERVAAEAGRIAGEWASRSELAASARPRRAARAHARRGRRAARASTRRWPCSTRTASGARSRSASRPRRRSAIALQTPPSTNLRAIEVVYRYRLDDAAEALGAPARRHGRAAARGRPGARLARGAQPLVERALLRRAIDALEGIAPPRRARARRPRGASPRRGSSPSSTR